jgi:TetR/AcrR family transcriptional regulator, cholesterol catabolism regulator
MARAAATDSLLDRILETSTVLFAENGVDRTSMRMIAESLGVTKAALYYHVDNKEDLHHKIQERLIETVLGQLREIAISDQSPPEKVRAVVRLSLNSIADHRDAHTILLREVRGLDDPSWSGVAEMRVTYRRTVAGILREGIEQGSFEVRDVEGATLALLGMCNWSYTWLDRGGKRSVDDLAELFADVFLHGISAPT